MENLTQLSLKYSLPFSFYPKTNLPTQSVPNKGLKIQHKGYFSLDM